MITTKPCLPSPHQARCAGPGRRGGLWAYSMRRYGLDVFSVQVAAGQDEVGWLRPLAGQYPLAKRGELVADHGRDGVSYMPVHVGRSADECIGVWEALQDRHLADRAEPILLG